MGLPTAADYDLPSVLALAAVESFYSCVVFGTPGILQRYINAKVPRSGIGGHSGGLVAVVVLKQGIIETDLSLSPPHPSFSPI